MVLSRGIVLEAGHGQLGVRYPPPIHFARAVNSSWPSANRRLDKVAT